MSSTALTIVVVLISAILGSGTAALMTQKAKSKRRTRALDVISGHRSETQKVIEPSKKDKEAAVEATSSVGDIAAKLKKAAREQKSQHNTSSIPSLLLQSGMTTSIARFWVYSVIFAVIATGLLLMSSLGRGVVVLLAFTCLFGLPRFYLKFKAGRRQKLFLSEFADALEAMIRLLKAGMPVTEAIAMVAREFTGPVGDEMARVYNAQKVGVPMAEAVRKMTPRMPLPEVQMFATAIAIQTQTGSSLSEVLGNLAGVIRARYRLKRKVQALSSEAKVSAMIIGALPIMVTLALWGVNPDYIGLLFTNPTGKLLLTGAIVWMGFGILSMKMMINFKV